MANDEMLQALSLLEKEKNISREVILEKIEEALMIACKQTYKRTDNIRITIDSQTCEYHVIISKEVVEEPMDPESEISLDEAQKVDGSYKIGDTFFQEIQSMEFGRIAAAAARNSLIQELHREENRQIFDEYSEKEHHIVTGVVQRKIGSSYSIDLGDIDATLTEREQIKGETYKRNDRYRFYITEVKPSKREPKVYVSRTHPELVKKLFEQEVSEIREGIVEIVSIAREAGNRTKMAVLSHDDDVDPVGACVGMNGTRVNAVVQELHNEKIDIVCWDENPARLIENALSPAKVISVIADSDEKTASVIVPDYQLSLAIGREGQNARLAARLTGFKIDIKSETQARESGDFPGFEEEYYEEDEGLYNEGEDSNVNE